MVPPSPIPLIPLEAPSEGRRLQVLHGVSLLYREPWKRGLFTLTQDILNLTRRAAARVFEEFISSVWALIPLN